MLCYLMLLETDADREQFSKLYTKYQKKLFLVANHILGSQSLAEEALQQTWINIIEHFEKISQISWDEIEPYIVTIVKHASLDVLRRETKTVSLGDAFDEPLVSDVSGETEFLRLVQLIRSMPEQYRSVLELKFVLEYSNKEIGKLLRLNESTVSTRISRGRSMLIQTLKKEGFVHGRGRMG